MSQTWYLGYVPGPEISYVASNPDSNVYDQTAYPSDILDGILFTADITKAQRFASQAALDAFYASRPTTLPVTGGTGSPSPITVVE